VSQHLAVERTAYVTRAGQYVFAGRGPGALSDHAVLSIDVTHTAPLSDNRSPNSLT
jgi:hypothetical protein